MDILPETLIVICGWCGRQIGTKLGYVVNGLNISHGLCRDCEARLLAENGTDRGDGRAAAPRES